MKTPSPFCFNPSKIKAFVLGCDPTNFSDNGKPVGLNYVFGIGQDHWYFSDILSNLQLTGVQLAPFRCSKEANFHNLGKSNNYLKSYGLKN